jgi:predicted DNA-binding transcriptional regulator AlpA
MPAIHPEAKAAPRREIGNLFVELDPNLIIRTKDGPKIWGLGPTQIAKKIRLGQLPAPVPLFETGRASAWTGAMVNEHRRKMAAALAAKKPGAK